MYRRGATISRFVTRDIRRDVEVVDDSEVDAGFVTVRVRTMNALYVVSGLAREPESGAPRRLPIDELWTWTGASWGGPVPRED